MSISYHISERSIGKSFVNVDDPVDVRHDANDIELFYPFRIVASLTAAIIIYNVYTDISYKCYCDWIAIIAYLSPSSGLWVHICSRSRYEYVYDMTVIQLSDSYMTHESSRFKTRRLEC